MAVAPATCVMRLSEFITIYLAAAAPFGVAYFLRANARGRAATLALARAAAAALLWPLTALVLLRASAEGGGEPEQSDELLTGDERRIEQARRALVNSLRGVEDVLESGRAACGEAERHALFAAREAVERYVGLTLAARGADAEAAPTEREMELCRLAGRAGEDLLTAGRCVHRRNVTRLVAHRERARSELVHALAGARETVIGFQTTLPRDAAAGAEISEALLHSLARAVELLSLLDDRGAVLAAARLLDAECARLRRLEARAEEKTSDDTRRKLQSPRLGVSVNNSGLKAGL